MTPARRPWAFERGRLWAIDLVSNQPRQVSPRVAAYFKEAGQELSELLVQLMGLPSPEQVSERFASGRRCFAAWVGNQIASICWVSQNPECIGELEREIRLRPDEAYIWDCLTLPDFRRRRLYSALLSFMLGALKSEGVYRVWIGSSLDNLPSIRAFSNAGFQPVISLIYLRMFAFSGIWLSSHPSAGKELIADARQMLVSNRERTWGPFSVSYIRPASHHACANMRV